MDVRRASVGLVLGAGGVAGASWHAAVLAVLAELGWDARHADLVVGTSAGSGTAAALRLGLAPSDLLAASVGEPMSEQGAAYAKRAGGPVQVPSLLQGPRRPSAMRPASPRMAVRRALTSWPPRPMLAVAGLAPSGRVSTAFIGDRIRRTHDRPWPDRPTWICAVRLDDGRRCVFGRDEEPADIDLATAVEASSAIPGFFAPVTHGEHRYVDGGAHSPTSADLVAGLGFDVVVVSSPMSATRAALRRLRWSGGRALHAATLRREVVAVRRSGTPVLVLQPGAEVVDAVGPNAMDVDRRADVARVATDEVRAHLASSSLADRLALLVERA